MEYDFSGYATKNNLKCSDGRVIRQDAFKDNDGMTVPLVWQHMHNDPSNVLGHARLENRADGVYTYAKFNDTESGRTAKALVEHGDIKSLSIHANGLVHKGKDVVHGVIREVSLVLSGANPGAHIDNLTMMHADGTTDTSDDEAIIYTGMDLSLDDAMLHESEEDDSVENEETIEDVFNTLTDKQKDVVYAMIGQVLENAKEDSVQHSSDDDDYDYDDYEDDDDDEEDYEDYEDDEDEDDDDEYEDEEEYEFEHSDEGENFMKKNVFDQSREDDYDVDTLSHAQFSAIVTDAQKFGSFKEAFLAHTDAYGIENVERLFPEPKLADGMPRLITRDMEWVGQVMGAVKNSPFSRIKSTAIDITADEARALGYVKGKKKKEEVVKALKRVTLPTTVYKKQKMDRDDIIDIVDLDVVAWLKREMRTLLNEELARAYLIGDGRDGESDDKIDEDMIRPIYKDDDLYAHKVRVSGKSVTDAIDDIIRARKDYKGSGSPVLYVNGDFLTDMLLLKDLNGRYIYNNENDLAVKLRVSKIVEVPVMENLTRTDAADDKELTLVGIIVNLRDYIVGTDRGGQINMFDDFDIDYNQHKYLIETRCSGALVQPKSALVLERLPEDPQ